MKNLVEVRDWRTGAVVVSATLPMENTGCTAWTPDGHTLLVRPSESGKTSAYAFDPAAPEPLRLARRIEGPYQGGGEITVNPAGDRFVTRGWGGSLHLFDADSGQLLFAIPAPASSRSPLRFDRTGQRLAWAPVGGQSQRLGLFSVAEGREYRYLVHAGSAGAARHWHMRQPAVHGGGRLAAVGQAEGVALFDLETGRELAHVPAPGRQCARFDGAGHLLTNGFNGFFRWPVRPDPALPGRLVVGPPERLPFHGGTYPVSASQDGRVIAQAMFAGYGMGAHAGGWILHPNSPTPRPVDPGASMNWTSVSPDGRWVAFGVNGGGVSVYDAATGARVCQPPANGYAHRFSADGRWFLTAGDNGGLFAAGTWEPGPQLGPGEPWDTTPELAVLGQSNGVYRLVELATGRELARLEDQEQNTGPAVFSPDGTRLVVEAENGLRVWDLRRIRAGLTALGLDWDAPPYPKADDAGNGPPLEGTIDRGDGDIDAWPRAEARFNLGNALAEKGQLDKAIAEYREAIRLKKDYALAHCNLGNCLVQQGQFHQAVKELRCGHELGSKNSRWASPSAQWVQNAKRLVELDDKLPDLLSRQKQPADTTERLGLAHLCQMPCKKRYAAAVRFFRDAFAEEPKLADDLNAGHRYNAVCAAALAGCGQGQDSDKLDPKERALLRAQALHWLQADLESWRKLLEKEPDKAPPGVVQKMQHWLKDADFAGVRGAESLARLPETERKGWQKLWQEVEVLRRSAAATTKSADQAKGKEGSPRKN